MRYASHGSNKQYDDEWRANLRSLNFDPYVIAKS